MTIKLAFLALFAASLFTGTAFAGALDNPAPQPSFTTGSIKAMTVHATMAGWTGSRECTATIDAQHNDRCPTTKQLGGAN
jgi:hypothetical protein